MTIERDADGFAIPPEAAPHISECSFYHTIDLPAFGVQRGCWDLRANVGDYLGTLDFAKQRVLEIGAANGFVTFEMERRGATVVGFDLDENLTYDAPPYSEAYLRLEDYRNGLRRIRNAYWLAHRLFGSRAKMAYGHANQLPEFLGRFDIGVIANVLQHLRDPVGALMQLARICNKIVVTEADWLAGWHDDLRGMILFDSDNPYVWYQVKPPLIEGVLSKMGFGQFRRTFHKQFMVQTVEHTADVGPRGIEQGIQVSHFTVTAELIDRSRL